MQTTTNTIAKSFTAAIKAAAKFFTVISAAASSRLRWRYVVSGPVNSGSRPGVVGQRLALLVPSLAMHHAKPAMAMICRPQGDACRGSRPSDSVRSRRLAGF
ncbi:hypothetical protein [Botrimarina mediterranea]|uniref:Uncharacterized protein n=1 Tax=Botrimarina mediterranea TaxID=2528022 RepID=A0A518K3I1_9BACT|nr:hypothetical protein [Botrimarina mediterranea]QDV72361.1 hypothetical protein Spa11_05350 [Botrimarina mediterranea]QDV76907.1 hypothetical protein K2D_04900 [Planctomycetes bacterium K2D]